MPQPPRRLSRGPEAAVCGLRGAEEGPGRSQLLGRPAHRGHRPRRARARTRLLPSAVSAPCRFPLLRPRSAAGPGCRRDANGEKGEPKTEGIPSVHVCPASGTTAAYYLTVVLQLWSAGRSPKVLGFLCARLCWKRPES